MRQRSWTRRAITSSWTKPQGQGENGPWNGRIAEIEDWLTANGAGLRYAYDDAGRLTRITDYDDATLDYTYDAGGNITTVNDYHGNDVTYTYTDTGQVATITAPGNKVWSFAYNAMGQPTRYVHPNGMATEYTYDVNGALIEIAHLDGQTVRKGYTYTLNDAGGIDAIAYEDGTVWEYGYDDRYRLTSAVRQNDATTPTITATYTYAYDAADNLTSKSEPFFDDFQRGAYDGWTVHSGTWSAANGYMSDTTALGQNDAFWRAQTNGDTDLRFSYRDTRSSTGSESLQVRVRASANSARLVYVRFDDDGTVRIGEYDNGQWTTRASASVSESYNTWYDVRILTEGDAVTVWRGPKGGAMEQVVQCSGVGYTDSDRLWFQTNYWATYDLDDIVAVGGSMGATTTTFTYTDANELATQTVNGVTTAFAYDAWGRMVEKAVQGGPSATYAYRYGDKLYSVASTFPGEGTVTFQYGGDGKRRTRTAGGVTTRYRWDAGWNLLNEETAAGVLAETNVYAVAAGPVSVRLAHIEGDDTASGASSFPIHDSLRSVRGICDGGRSLLAEYEYTPYGGAYSSSGARALADAPGAFTGRRYDSAAGMYLAPLRGYISAVGRWNGRDPVGMADGPNAHAYVGGNPVNYSDPLGLWKAAQHGAPYAWPDELGATAPLNLWIWYWEGRTQYGAPMGTGLHFMSRESVIGWMDSTTFDETSALHCNEALFQLQMHALQDTYSHYEPGWRWWTGGHVLGLHGPDIPHLNEYNYTQWLAMREATGLFEFRYYRWCGRPSYDFVRTDMVNDLVDLHNGSIAAMNLLRSMIGLDPLDVPFLDKL